MGMPGLEVGVYRLTNVLLERLYVRRLGVAAGKLNHLTYKPLALGITLHDDGVGAFHVFGLPKL
jgi:hypothetical protein